MPLCFGQAPPNDNFADRIKLEGNSIVFTGILAGATFEESEPLYSEYVEFCLGDCNETVWWSWTASESTSVILLALEHSSKVAWWEGFLRVWAATNLNGFPTNTPWPTTVVSMRLDPAFPGAWVIFSATAGMDYQIRLAGNSHGSHKLRLVATTSPIIFEQPKSLTVAPNASAFFGVMAAGIRPFNYQWQFNGTPLPDETNAMLALNNVTANQAGLYSVVISNSMGVTISEPANLQMSDVIGAPSLSVRQIITNSFDFIFSGQTGKNYRIEYSTNLINWLPATNFPLTAYLLTSVIFNGTNNLALSVSRNSTSKFIRASTYSALHELCNNNLRQIRFAHELWARDYNKVAQDTPQYTELLQYLKNKEWPTCPQGGEYWSPFLHTVPTCTTPGHVLEEPW